VVDDPTPVPSVGAGDPAELAAELGFGLDEMDHLEPAPAEGHRALEPRRPAPTTSTGVSRFAAGSTRSGASRDGAPRRGRVLDAAEVPKPSTFMMQTFEPVHSRISSVRPSAIFCGRNGSAIEGRAEPTRSHARAHDLRHEVRVREACDADDRLVRRLADTPRPLELVALLEVPRGAGVVAPERDRADVHVHRSTNGSASATNPAPPRGDPGGPETLHGDPRRDRAVGADGLLHLLERLEPERARPAASRRSRRSACCRRARGTASAVRVQP